MQGPAADSEPQPAPPRPARGAPRGRLVHGLRSGTPPSQKQTVSRRSLLLPRRQDRGEAANSLAQGPLSRTLQADRPPRPGSDHLVKALGTAGSEKKNPVAREHRLPSRPAPPTRPETQQRTQAPPRPRHRPASAQQARRRPGPVGRPCSGQTQGCPRRRPDEGAGPRRRMVVGSGTRSTQHLPRGASR